MMNRKLAAVIAIAMLIALVFASCGRNNPKSLAKQTVDLTAELMEAYFSDDERKIEQLTKRAEALEERIEKLSEADQEIYYEEFVRLVGDMSDFFSW